MKVTMPARDSHFSISITGGFAFGHCAKTSFHVVYIQHAVLKGLSGKFLN